jgi:3-hydroxybutyryl-CoA dehydrogenase
MPLVEIVAAPATEERIKVRAAALVQGWGKTAVLSRDSPGFIVNRVNRPFTLEALAMLERGEAGVASIDDAVRAAGYPMGPFELMDLIGVDVNLAVARAIWEGFGRPERFRPSPIQERLVGEGRLGRKTGAGFYRYDDGRRGEPLEGLRDGPLEAGAIVERIELAIVAEAYRALADEVAAEPDIELALRLGAGHPMGPFERTRAWGGRPVVLARLRDRSGLGPRFEPPPTIER